jgi:hypothetical protein
MRLTRLAACGGLLLALAAGLGLALWPCAYQGVAATGGATPEQPVCASMVQTNGVSVLGVLTLPALLAVVGLVAVRGRHRWLLVVVMVVLVAFCVLALASIGLFYLPAAIALIVAVVGWPQPPARPWAGDGPLR